MKAIILNNQSRSMSIFWRMLMEEMRLRGIRTLACVPPGDPDSEKTIRETGAEIIHYPLNRKGLNPLQDMGTYLQLKKIMKRERPDIVFASTIKPVIYGCLAAKSATVPGIFATITGLGYVFEKDRWHKKLIHQLGVSLYRKALRNITGVFFQNRDDATLFAREKIISKRQKILFAPGTGVDTNYFSPAPFPEGGPVFLLTGRLLEAKGIEEYAQAAAMLREKWPRAQFRLLGIPEHGPGSFPLEKIEEWHKRGIIEYVGQARDVRPFIAACHTAVLPSWREGVPTSLMEAMSMGRPCVATDSPGCREAVVNGENGFLCEVRNASSLAMAMEKFILQPELVARMGAKSRKMACEIFDGKKVARGIMDDMLGLARFSS